MFFTPEIPDNNSTEHIKNFIKNCEIISEKDYDENDDAFIFNPAATIEDINSWEQKNNIQIPSSYKDWLLFSNGSILCDSSLEFYSLDDIVIDNNQKPYNIPDEYIIIGSFTDIEEWYGFSRNTGQIVIFGEYEETEVEGFEEILDILIKVM